jgi:hypothetical protein
VTARRREAMLLAVLCIAVAGALAGCDDQGSIPPVSLATHTASATVVASSPPSSSAPSPLPSFSPPPPPPSRAPVPLRCSPPSAEPASAPSGSALTFSGMCNFTEASRVACSSQPDDFIFQFSRPTSDGPTIYFQLNVEFFKGPGRYMQNVQMLFEIPDNGTMYEWDTSSGSATIDSGQRSGSISNVALPADPGTPSTGTITVSGSFACA